MNNDNEANDANDNGDKLFVGQPETERQELLRLRREFEQARQRMLQEREQLLRDIQCLRQEMQDDADAHVIEMERRPQLFQVQAFAIHVLAHEQQQQQQAESVEEDAEEDTDAVSLSMVEPNPQSVRCGQQQQKIQIGARHESCSVKSAKNATPTLDAHNKDLTRLIPNQLRCMQD